VTDRITAAGRSLINRARALSSARGTEALRIVVESDASDPAQVLAEALGTAQFYMGELAALVERLGGGEDQGAEDTRRLNAIREVLAHFDWEFHDRQLALEAIERIVEGGHA
jgi:hypothetical protein